MSTKRLIIAVLLASAIFFWMVYAPPKIRIGEKAPDFTLPNAQGKWVTLSEFSGNFVLINFWASWCGPCIEEMPSLAALARRMADRPFTIIAISEDEAWESIAPFIPADLPHFLVVKDREFAKVADDYGTYRLPESYLIDPAGNLIKKGIGLVNWEQEPVITKLVGGGL